MKAMILAAGLGTRLRPLTDTMPKALISIKDKPLLEYVIEKLKVAGFEEIIINIHHFGQQIIDFVQSKNCFGIRIEFSDERDNLLDTGGAIKKAAWFFDDGKPFLIHNVDILSNIDLCELCEYHKKHAYLASLVVSHRKTSRYLLFDENNLLKGWINTKTGERRSPFTDFDSTQYTPLAFSGIHVLHPDVFNYMNNFPEKFSIVDFYLSICNREKLYGYVPRNLQLIDVGKLDSLSQVEKTFLIL